MELPRFGLGTYQLHGQVCHDMVCCALQRGYSLIDTAQVYRNEHIVGTALKRSGVPRNKVFLVSKLHPKHLGSPETLEASVLESLEKLGIDYIDLYAAVTF
jgi:diketogulonate reductase-like aldo/keto reductase